MNLKFMLTLKRSSSRCTRMSLKKIKSGALEEVNHRTPNRCKAFFVQKPGSPDSDPSVRLVKNMKPVNHKVETVRYQMDWSSHIMRRLEQGDDCFGVINLVQVFHQVPVHED